MSEITSIKYTSFPTGAKLFLSMLLASFCVSRASVSVTADRKEFGPQKWLIYPSLILVYIALAYWLFLWPVPVSWLYVCQYLKDLLDVAPLPSEILLTRFGMTAILLSAIWCMLLGIILRARPRITCILFRPFAGPFNRKLAIVLIYTGLAVLLLWAAQYYICSYGFNF